jgi:hypothetical protein
VLVGTSPPWVAVVTGGRPLANKIAPTNVKRLLHRRSKAYARKLQWQTLLQQTYRYSQPNRNILDLTPIGGASDFIAQGSNLNWCVYDLTLQHATDVYVNRMVNALIPPGKQWLNFVPGVRIPDEYKEEVTLACQALTDLFFFYLNQSNFNLVAPETFYDMCVSTGYMIINEGEDIKKPLIFAAMPPYITYACEGPYGTFDGYFRDFVQLPIEHAKAMWPDFIVPDHVVQKDNEEPCITLYESICYNYDDHKWHYVIIYPDTEQICYERIDETSPCVGFRAKKLPGEVDGRGPAMDAMPAAATINQAMFDEIQSANFRALPIYMGFDDGVFNPYQFKMVPNTVIACSPSASGTWPLQALPPAGDIQWTNVVVGDLRAQINEIMLANPFGPVDAPVQTATEIVQRQQQILENASAAFSRIQREFFEPVVERVVDILRRKGLWTDIEIDGEVLAVTFETPLTLSESQKDVLDLMQFHQSLAAVIGPEAAVGFYNLEALSPWLAQKLNIPLELVKNTEQIREIIDKTAEIQQQQAEAEQQAVAMRGPE